MISLLLLLPWQRKIWFNMSSSSISKKQLQNVQSPTLEIDKHPQKVNSVGERLKGCIPNDTASFLFTTFVMVYLFCAVTHMGDMTMLQALLPYIAGYAGMPKVTPLLPWNMKGGENHQK
jgi:hypothetical protein